MDLWVQSDEIDFLWGEPKLFAFVYLFYALVYLHHEKTSRSPTVWSRQVWTCQTPRAIEHIMFSPYPLLSEVFVSIVARREPCLSSWKPSAFYDKAGAFSLDT
jgi:hypothetical protein